jgi:hypothetical protein
MLLHWGYFSATFAFYRIGDVSVSFYSAAMLKGSRRPRTACLAEILDPLGRRITGLELFEAGHGIASEVAGVFGHGIQAGLHGRLGVLWLAEEVLDGGEGDGVGVTAGSERT